MMLRHGSGCHPSDFLLRKLRQEIAMDKPAVNLKRMKAIFTAPLLIAETEFRGWTEDGKLRHTPFKGVRERADDATVHSLEE